MEKKTIPVFEIIDPFRPKTLPGMGVEQTFANSITKREIELYEDQHGHPPKFRFKHSCGTAYLLDKDPNKTNFKCICETEIKDKFRNHLYICEAAHAHFDIFKLNWNAMKCPECLKIQGTETKAEKEAKIKARKKRYDEKRQTKSFLQRVSEEKEHAAHHQKEHEAEMLAKAIVKVLGGKDVKKTAT